MIPIQVTGIRTANATETKTGLITVTGPKLSFEVPRADITFTITSPTTSSIIAALVRITPSLLSVSPEVVRTVNVVPSEVEHNAAPAAKACKGVMLNRPCNTNERAIGAHIPVTATTVERKRFAFRVFTEVLNPPKEID